MSYTLLDTGKAMEIARGHKDLRTKLEVLGFDVSRLEQEELNRGIIEPVDLDDNIPYVYITKSNRLFLLSQHKSIEPEDYLLQGHRDKYGTYDFALMYYNGGTCFEEMFEDLVNKIDSEEEQDS